MTEIPQVTPPITPPNRVNASATYDQETHDFRMSEIQMAEELVLAIDALNVVSEEVEDAAAAALDDAIEASDAAAAASDSADEAADSETQAGLYAAAAGAAIGIPALSGNGQKAFGANADEDGTEFLDELFAHQYSDKVSTLSGTAVSMDLSSAGLFLLTLTGNTVITLSGAPPSGQNRTTELRVTGGGAFTVSFAGMTVKTAGGESLEFPASGQNSYVLRTSNVGGTVVVILSAAEVDLQ